MIGKNFAGAKELYNVNQIAMFKTLRSSIYCYTKAFIYTEVYDGHFCELLGCKQHPGFDILMRYFLVSAILI